MKKIVRLIVALLIIIVLMVGGVFAYSMNQLKPANDTGTSVSFTVESGRSAKQVILDLADKDIIKDGQIAYVYARLTKNYDFKAGPYEIPGGLDVEGVLNYISDSHNILQDTVSITFIEGDWLKDFAAKLSNKTNLEFDELMAYWNDEAVLDSLIDKYEFLTDEILGEDIRYPLEGYFFPDTYEFYRETTPQSVTEKFLNNTQNVFEKYHADFMNSELSIHEVFTLASIVQYEGVRLDDMKGIASVFFNRLAIGMKLQSSVTVCYSLDLSDDDNWTMCEFNNDYDSPYNTYMHEGLTPGPIVSPGENALYAVLHPDDTDYYFFIGDVCGDGTVYFAETYEEHNRNIKEYLWCY